MTLGVSGELSITFEAHSCFQKFYISASDFISVSMRRRFCAYANEFFTAVNKGVVHGVYQVVMGCLKDLS